VHHAPDYSDKQACNIWVHMSLITLDLQCKLAALDAVSDHLQVIPALLVLSQTSHYFLLLTAVFGSKYSANKVHNTTEQAQCCMTIILTITVLILTRLVELLLGCAAANSLLDQTGDVAHV